MDASTVLVTGISLLSLGGLYYNVKSYVKRRSAQEEYTRAKVHTPASLYKTIKLLEWQKSVKKNPDNPDELILQAFVEGKVECKEPIKSALDRKTPLVFSIVFHDEIRSNDYLHPRDRDAYDFLKYKKSDKQAPLYFALRDPEAKNLVLVHRNFEANTDFALDKIAVHKKEKSLNFLEKILIFIGMILEFFNVARGDNNSPFFRGMKIGWTETEFGIQINTPLTIFGDVIYNTQDTSLRIDTPLYFLKDKSYLVKKIKDDKVLNVVGICLFMIPSVFTGVYLGRKMYKYVKDYLRKREERSRDKSNGIKFLNLQDDYKCIICVNNPRNVILKPCLHFSICSNCFANLRQECPVCRKHVDDHIEIFFT